MAGLAPATLLKKIRGESGVRSLKLTNEQEDLKMNEWHAH